MNIYNVLFFMSCTIASIGIAQHCFTMEEKQEHQNVTTNYMLNVPIYTDGEIQDYNHERDEATIKAIAMENISELASVGLDFSDKNYKRILETQVVPALNSPDVLSKVYLYKGTPVAFINYSFAKQWYKVLPFTKNIGPNAYIHHIAVDEPYQKQGIGSALLTHAISDCSNRKVHAIILGTSNGASTAKLDTFYRRQGFRIIQQGTYAFNGSRWKKDMEEGPIIIMGKNMIKAVKTGILKLK